MTRQRDHLEGLARLTDELELLTYRRTARDRRADPPGALDRREPGRERRLLRGAGGPGAARAADRHARGPDRGRGARRPGREHNDVVDVGERVRLHDLDERRGDRLRARRLARSRSRRGTDLHVSPLGRALLGRRPGEIVVVDAPLGERRFELLAIETPTYARG